MSSTNDAIGDFLSQARDNAPDDLQHYFLSFEDYWERKLWHELTDLLVKFYQEPQGAGIRIPLYENFVKSFGDKINQLKLVQIGLSAAGQWKDDNERLTFLSTLASRVDKPASQDAYVFALTAVAFLASSTRDPECDRTDRGSYPRRELYRNVHLTHGYVKLVHVVCSGAVDAEELIYRSSKDFSQPSAPYYAVRHEDCLEVLHEGQPSDPEPASRMSQSTDSLSIGLTRVCRDIHCEAALIPYANNTFAFRSGFELDSFVTKSLLAPQRAAINILQVEGLIAANSMSSGITRKVAKMLTGLHTLEIISQRWGLHMYRDSTFRMFSRSLETVRVVYEDNWKAYDEVSAELKAQLRTQAEGVERCILNKV
ncbi:hypothetical protein D0863_12169 [Hortaea werneckii]|uniref:PSD13 N-terminal domain-containing protein n=1 Tax=Hortaea werneckii TaxID=91943 RepID=A0A3M7D3I2_HORWE|nr:hypothetical protein D0863_12169 [Hortaea werneckii]